MRLKKHEREKLKKKYGGHCAYCGIKLGDKWDADHLKPITRLSDGTALNPELDCIENLMPSCKKCNNHKFSYELEHWRKIINDNRQQLLSSTKFKTLNRLGLAEIKEDPVVFYFESFKDGE